MIAPVVIAILTLAAPSDLVHAVEVLDETTSWVDLEADAERELADDAWRASVEVLAETGVWVDPLHTLVLARRESGLRTHAIGDQGRSCGITQIRTDFPGRPTCRELTSDRAFALTWTTRRLARDSAEGKLRIARYNGAGEGARQYERAHWRLYFEVAKATGRAS